jgi:hypothetical protein
MKYISVKDYAEKYGIKLYSHKLVCALCYNQNNPHIELWGLFLFSSN